LLLTFSLLVQFARLGIAYPSGGTALEGREVTTRTPLSMKDLPVCYYHDITLIDKVKWV